MAGSKSVAGRHKRFALELGRTKVFQGSREGAEQNVTARYVILVVGLTHIRGVNRVKPIENTRFTRRG